MLNNHQIDAEMKNIDRYQGCYSKDNLPEDLEDSDKIGYYVVNMENSNKGHGTHWVALAILPSMDREHLPSLRSKGMRCLYFDSFGELPPKEVIDYCPEDVSYNTVDVQALDSESCGEFCIYFLKELDKGRRASSIVRDFHGVSMKNNFELKKGDDEKSLERNEEILKSLMQGVGINGTGVTDVFTNVFNEGVDRVKTAYNGREGAPPRVRDFIARNGDSSIVTLRIARSPIQSGVKKFLNIVSLGKLSRNQKALNYDEIFHLYFLMTLNDGRTFRVEKNQVVVITPQSDYVSSKDTDIKNVDLNGPIKVKDFFSKAYAGNKHLYVYDAVYANCQQFTIDCLYANNIITPELKDFAKQNAVALLEDAPVAKQTSLALPRLAAAADVLIHGASLFPF